MREFKMENETTIEVGETYRFADLWSGNGDEAEIFESGAFGLAMMTTICRLWQILRS